MAVSTFGTGLFGTGTFGAGSVDVIPSPWDVVLGADTIDIHNAPLGPDSRYGNERRDWAAMTTTTVAGCSVQPYTAAEITADREFTDTHLRLFAPHTAPLAATSRVVFDGTVYEVDGTPGRWRDLDGRPSHIEATLKRADG